MSSSDLSETEETQCIGVEGFQFEPLRNLDDSWETVEEYDDDDDSEPNLDRLNLSIDDWCHCKVCVHMPTEKECICCHELEFADLFDSKGIYGNVIFTFWYRSPSCYFYHFYFHL